GVTPEGEQLLTGPGVPQLDLSRLAVVAGGTGEPFAVRAVSHERNRGRMPFQGEHFLSGGRVPYLQGPVCTAAHQTASVRAEGRAQDVAGVPFEAEDFLTGPGVAHLHQPFVAGDEAFAVRRESRAADPGQLILELEDLPAGVGVPGLDVADIRVVDGGIQIF